MKANELPPLSIQTIIVRVTLYSSYTYSPTLGARPFSSSHCFTLVWAQEPNFSSELPRPPISGILPETIDLHRSNINMGVFPYDTPRLCVL